MFPEVLGLLTALGAVILLYAGIQSWHRSQALQRLVARGEQSTANRLSRPARSILVRWHWVSWLVGLLMGGSLFFFIQLRPVYCIVGGVMVGLIGGQLEAALAAQRAFRMELLLADAIDIMVGTLRAGAGVLNALDQAAIESRVPLQDLFEEVQGRIRLGDPANKVFHDFSNQVPLESYRLFASALAVHWEVGGSLAPSLATVGRTIRDRIELTRRVRAMTAQSRMSTIAVLIATYAIAAIMWANDPDRMRKFLVSDLGSGLVAITMTLQAVGIVWSSALGKLRF